MWYKILTVNTAEALAKITAGVAERDLDDYLKLRCLGSSILAIANGLAGNSGSIQDFYTARWTEDSFTKTMAATQKQISEAVLVSMLAAQKGRLMGGSRTLSNIAEYLKPSMVRFLLEANDMMGEIQPRTRGSIGGLDVSGIKKKRDELLNSGGKTELLAILGLNGSGKTKVVEAMAEFGQRLNMDVCLVKFPRGTGDTGRVIQSNLEVDRKEKVGKNSLQLLFLADMFDFLATLDMGFPICVADRLPVYDGQVYSPDFMKFMSLWAMEGIDVPVTALIVDRHPALCRLAVSSRNTKPRTFEVEETQMALQQVEFWRLLGLPGVFLVNVDVSDPRLEGKLAWMRYYAVLATAMAGVWGRSLVKLGVAENLGAANKIVNKEVNEWFIEKVFDRDGNYRFGENG